MDLNESTRVGTLLKALADKNEVFVKDSSVLPKQMHRLFVDKEYDHPDGYKVRHVVFSTVVI